MAKIEITYTTHLDPDIHPGDYMYGIVPIPKPPMAAPEGYYWELQPQLHKDDDPYELLWVAVVDTPPAAPMEMSSVEADLPLDDMNSIDILMPSDPRDAELASLRARVATLEVERKLYRKAIHQIDWRMRLVRDPLKRWEPEVEMIDFGTWLCNTKRDYQFTQDLKKLFARITDAAEMLKSADEKKGEA